MYLLLKRRKMESKTTCEDKNMLPGETERKLMALKEGLGTDCVFLVGPDDQNAEIIHGSKFDLCASSEYFAGLFRSPFQPPGPVRIKHIQPFIFRLVVEFAHIHQLYTKVTELEDSVLLARAADECLMSELGGTASTLIYHWLDEENVWKLFEENLMHKFVFASCQKFLCENTLECLQHPTFLEIQKETLLEFLSFDKMNINSESDLVRACVNIGKQKGAAECSSLIRAAIPRLRLLTIEDDLTIISEWLTEKEKKFLLSNICSHVNVFEKEINMPHTICSETNTRCLASVASLGLTNVELSLDFSPDINFLSSRVMYSQKCRVFRQNTHVTFCIIAKELLVIEGFDIFCAAPKYVVPEEHAKSKNLLSDWIDKGMPSYSGCNVTITITVRNKDGSHSESCIADPSNFVYAHPFVHIEKPVIVPIEGTFELVMSMKTDSLFPVIELESITRELSSVQNPFAMDTISNVIETFYEPSKPSGICIVKKLYYRYI